ncbi:MAG: hypothetical protein PHE54_04605 [Bacilli bacterium]|nr:hypothetical protein [Bacilli bacterium]
MKKVQKNGFMLAETLIVSVFVLTTLVVIYAQFRMINSSYSYTFKYNTVNNIYLTDELRSYLNEDITSDLLNDLESVDEKFIEISYCQSKYINNTNYCNNLFDILEINQVLITKDDLTNLKEALKTTRYLDEKMISFIDTIKYDGLDNTYRIIVSYQDGTYASLRLN